MSDPIPPNEEIERQYRVLRQTIDAHSFLRERYSRWATGTHICLLACSVVFCATTFAHDDLYRWIGFEPTSAKYFRGVASVVSFGAALILLVLDFKGKAALHGAALDRWARVLTEFRQVQPAEGEEWPTKHRKRLHRAYWGADKESVNVPNASFTSLKGKHLRKIEISKLKSRYPGCPRLLLWTWIRGRDTFRFLKEFYRDDGSTNARTKEAAGEVSGKRVSHGEGAGG